MGFRLGILTQLASYKNILILKKILPKNYRYLIDFTDFLSVETLMLTPSSQINFGRSLGKVYYYLGSSGSKMRRPSSES